MNEYGIWTGHCGDGNMPADSNNPNGVGQSPFTVCCPSVAQCRIIKTFIRSLLQQRHSINDRIVESDWNPIGHL